MISNNVYWECMHCGQVVQGFEAAHSLKQECVRLDHKWKFIGGLDNAKAYIKLQAREIKNEET